jgi:hypothetical protein
LIESAFETARFSEKDYVLLSKKDLELLNSAINFGRGFGDDEERLLAIMKNIVKNKGTFKP